MKIFRLQQHRSASTDRIRYFRAILFAGVCLTLLSGGGANSRAEEADRLLVAVNGFVITEGDLYIYRGYKALASNGERNRSVTRGEEIDRLVNLELIRQELENLNIDPGEESAVRARYGELRDRFPGSGGVEALLVRFGIQEAELLSFLKLEISIRRFMEFRFRPFIRVSPAEIEAYYREKLAPPLEKAGVVLPPLDSVSDEIQRNLKEEKVNEELDEWIEDARRTARIEYFGHESPDAPDPGGPREGGRTSTME